MTMKIEDDGAHVPQVEASDKGQDLSKSQPSADEDADDIAGDADADDADIQDDDTDEAGDEDEGHGAVLRKLRENAAEKERLMRKAHAMMSNAQDPLIKMLPRIVALYPGVVDLILSAAKTLPPKKKNAVIFHVSYVLKANGKTGKAA